MQPSDSAPTFDPPERNRLLAEPPTNFEAQALTDFHARHIAIILHDFSTGGSERIAIRLANRWVQMGRRVSLYCGTEQGQARALVGPGVARSEEHTSELQSLMRISYAVFCLKKKQKNTKKQVNSIRLDRINYRTT